MSCTKEPDELMTDKNAANVLEESVLNAKVPERKVQVINQDSISPTNTSTKTSDTKEIDQMKEPPDKEVIAGQRTSNLVHGEAPIEAFDKDKTVENDNICNKDCEDEHVETKASSLSMLEQKRDQLLLVGTKGKSELSQNEELKKNDVGDDILSENKANKSIENNEKVPFEMTSCSKTLEQITDENEKDLDKCQVVDKRQTENLKKGQVEANPLKSILPIGNFSTENLTDLNEIKSTSVSRSISQSDEKSNDDLEEIQSNTNDRKENGKKTELSNDSITDSESSPRNVFDAFPINSTPITESNEIEKRTEVSDNNLCIQSSSKINQSELKLNSNGNTGVESDNLVKNQIEGSSTSTPNSCVDDLIGNDAYDTFEISDENRSRFVMDKQQLTSMQNKDLIHEAEILKKAKQKYQLKELRVSLHSDELINDLGELTPGKGQSEKGFNMKVTKTKTKDENSVLETKSTETLVENATLEGALNDDFSVKDSLHSSSKTMDHYLDNDCAKPLKKRCRRGYEESKDSVHIDEHASSAISFESSLEKDQKSNDLEKLSCVSAINEDLSSTYNQDDEITSNKPAIPNIRKDKKSGKKFKCKKAEKPVSAIHKQTDESNKDKSSNSVESESADVKLSTVSKPKTLSNSVQLKKYPGRSCKLRNQLPQAIVKPKKVRSPPKSKQVDKNDESTLKTTTSSLDEKVKKKRKRKVKPWSWGNEKKKYKPKPKIPTPIPEEGNIQERQEVNSSSIVSDNHMKENEVMSTAEETVNGTVCTINSEESKSLGGKDEMCAAEITELDSLKTVTTLHLESEHLNGITVCKAKRQQKKGKRVGRPKSKKVHVDCEDCNQISPLCVPTTSDTVSTDQINLETETVLSEKPDTDTKKCEENIESKINISDIQQTHTEHLETVISTSKQTVPKRKRGRSKGDGKGKGKKRKISDNTSVSYASVTEQINEKVDKVQRNPPNENINQEPEGLLNVIENEMHVDHYPHVSPDSGIQSLAGSPAGNESPNSVIINVDNSNNPTVVVAKPQHKNESDIIEPCASGTGLETDCVEDHRTEVGPEQSANESQKECVVIENVSDKALVECDKSNGSDTDVKELDKSKDSFEDCMPSNSNDIQKDTISNSPSKKKNRAKFLHLHKASTLLQKGRLPTDEEIEKRLDDKFDYPEKAAEKLPTNPPIDVYSQHMNSFQVTHGSYTEMLETSPNDLEKVLNCDLLHTLKEKRKGKKSHSKHKSKRKSNSGKSETSRASLFEKLNDIQNHIDSEVTDKSLCVAVVSTSSSVISNYSPVYHSSSVLTPVTVTLSSVAMTDSVSTSMSVTKPIPSVLHTTNSSTTIENIYINESETNFDLLPSISQSNDKDLIRDTEIPTNSTPQTEHVISQVNNIPIKRKPGRPPNKKKGIISIKNKVFNKVIKVKKSLTPLSVNKINSVKEKRKPGRPKGSKNKKSLEKEKALLKSLQLKEQNGEIENQQKVVGRNKGVISPVRDKKSNNFDSFKDQSVEVKKSLSFGCHSKHENDKPPNFSNKMAWRESSVLGHDNEEKKKRGPGRPRKHPLGSKTIVSKKQNKKESVSDLCNNEKGNKSQVTNAVDSVSSEPFLDLLEGESLPSVFKDTDGSFVDETVKQLPKIRKSKLHPMLKKGKRGRKKGFKVKRKSEQSVPNVENTEECEPEDNITDLQPARSVSSHDSDTSGAGSSLCSKSFQMQMWMDMDKNRRKNKKQKLKYFRSKHKNIIDPVFISKVDCLINDFTQVSISPPGETFLKVRPWEVPLPSIFKIVRINIKKKKNKLFVFEKAKPLKPKNEQESSSKDKIKLGRKIGDHIMGLNDISDQQHCNLPPKKRHKLFSGLGPNDCAEGNLKPEKRKTGRPRKVRHLSPDQGASFSFGEVHKTKQGLGQDDIEALESFASVAASSQSPNSSFSQDKISASFSPISPKSRKSDNSLESPSKVNTNDQTHPTSYDTSDQNRRVGESANEVDDTPNLRESQTCDKCSELQSTILEESYLSAKVNSPKIVTEHLNRKVKRLKRKYRRSKKFTRRKQKLGKTSVIIEGDDSLDLDSSVRSVCSESEPLPSLYSDKRKLESDSEDDIVVDKHKKLSKRRTSDASQESDTAAVRKQNGPINQKKKYQKAGLYSDAYKDDEKSETKEAVDTYFTFDLPLHFGQHQLRNLINDFQLPYDVWWLNFNDMLPKKGDGKQYRSIRNNIYVDARPACRYEAHACSCKKPLNPSEKGCGEDCINRLVYTECSPSLCPCYDQCSNQSIQKHQFAAGLQKFLTKDRGFGVRTTKPIKLGQLIAEYCGEVVSEQEFRRRMTEEYSQDRNHYCLNLDSGTVIDGYRKGNIARFVNHSCEPNCEMQKWNVDGVYHMCLFALRDIEPSEELVYDYNFQSFNHDAQQLCKCGSEECRGIIGGKKQWFNGQVKSSEKLTGKKSKHLKDKRKSKQKSDKMKDKNKKYVTPGFQQGLPHSGGHPIPPYFTYPIKPLMKKERIFARKHSIFLVRNFDRIRGMKDRSDQDTYKGSKEEEDYIKGTHFTKRDVFITQLTALKTSRSMKTRRLTVAEEDTEVSKMARIAGVCKEMYSTITAAKDEEGSFLATDLYHLPSKKKHPRYYQVIEEPIDLTMIQKKILSGMYQSVELFEKDVIKLFHNVELYCGKKSEMGEKIQVLRSVFSNAKRDGLVQIQELLGPDTQSSDSQTGTLSDVDVQVATPTTSVSSESDISEISDNKGEWLHGDDDEEEIIRCICGIFKDEGLMIQCDKCYIWQHTDCMRVKGDIGHYLCEQCDPRPVDMEVELVPGFDILAEPNEDGNRYFMTLMRDDMQIRLGACVYVMKENQSRRYSYKKSGGLDKDRMDIFRIERLWKTKKGEKYAFGHMYVRPHETFHEPNRKFFPNEVFRTPLYEMFELESITGHCCVLDLLTYCKGKPKGYRDEDLYICEHRMDKTLHLFYKISAKQRYPVNTLSYCFEMYEKRLNPKRTYSPHEVPESYKRNWREKSSSSDDTAQEKKQVSDEEEDIPLVKVKMERRKEKRDRVNKILDSLSRGKLSPSKKRSDLTYLLTDRPVSSTSSIS